MPTRLYRLPLGNASGTRKAGVRVRVCVSQVSHTQKYFTGCKRLIEFTKKKVNINERTTAAISII